MSCQPFAGQAKSNSDTCFFDLLAALSDRQTNHFMWLEDFI
jgi:hypothetical protein